MSLSMKIHNLFIFKYWKTEISDETNDLLKGYNFFTNWIMFKSLTFTTEKL